MKNLQIRWKLLSAGTEIVSILRREEFYCPYNLGEKGPFQVNPAGVYLLKVNYRNSRIRCEICSN